MKLLKIVIIILGILLLLCSPFFIARTVVSLGKLVETIPECASELREVKSLEIARDAVDKGGSFDRLAEFKNGSWILFKSKHTYKFTSNILDYGKPWFIGLKFNNSDLLFIVDETGSSESFMQFHNELADLLEEQSYEQKFFLRDIQDFCAEENLVMFRYE